MDIIPPQPHAPPIKPLYFPVSVVKLAVLGFATGGLYELYWAWQNWKLIQLREKSDIMPFWRAFFGVIWIIPLLLHMRGTEVRSSTTKPLPAVALGIVYIVLTVLWRLPDPYWLVTLFAIVPLLFVQQHANRINNEFAPGHDPNTRFTWANWIWIILGSTLLILAFIGTFVPENQ